MNFGFGLYFSRLKIADHCRRANHQHRERSCVQSRRRCLRPSRPRSRRRSRRIGAHAACHLRPRRSRRIGAYAERPPTSDISAIEKKYFRFFRH